MDLKLLQVKLSANETSTADSVGAKIFLSIGEVVTCKM